MTDRPLIPEDLLPLAIAETSGCSIDVARAEALPLLEYLSDNGAFITYGVALADRAVAGKRSTSRKAAESIADLGGGMKAVYDLIAANGSHGLTDDELAQQYDGFAAANGYPPLAPDSPRKRRMQLADARLLVDSGTTRPSRYGREQIVWVASGTEVSRLAAAS
jgi:hypothetical protein